MNLATMGYDDPNLNTSPQPSPPFIPQGSRGNKGNGGGEESIQTLLPEKSIVWMANLMKLCSWCLRTVICYAPTLLCMIIRMVSLQR